MIVSLDEMKQYLRVDFEDDDAIITALITGAEKLCSDILRADSTDVLTQVENGRVAVMYLGTVQPIMIGFGNAVADGEDKNVGTIISICISQANRYSIPALVAMAPFLPLG